MATTGIDTKPQPLDGRLLHPDDAGYDAARSVWNAMIDHRPAVIVRCASEADVAAAVRLGRERDLRIGVHCGGHDITGLSVPHDGLMIDLRPLAAVCVDPVARRARVQGGALLGALDRAAQVHGLATTAGNVSHTGVGGLTLGGGMGWLARRHGLTCDNVVAFTVVTADGSTVRCDADVHPDLFWALRGGGGNFGVVTEFEFRLHPVGTRALVVELSFLLDRAAAALRGWRDLAALAPREATLTASVTGEAVTVGFVWVGDPDGGRALLSALRTVGAADSESVRELSYLALQTCEDDVQDHRRRRYWKSHYLPGLPDEAIAALLDRDPAGSCLPSVGLQTWGGAIADHADDATAFSHRGARFMYTASAGWDDPDEDAMRTAAARRSAARLQPFAFGAYVNALSDEGDAGVSRAYSDANHARLTAVKRIYDPENVFRLNHNIVPQPDPVDA